MKKWIVPSELTLNSVLAVNSEGGPLNENYDSPEPHIDVSINKTMDEDTMCHILFVIVPYIATPD